MWEAQEEEGTKRGVMIKAKWNNEETMQIIDYCVICVCSYNAQF